MFIKPHKPSPSKSFTLDNGLLVELCQVDVGLWSIFVNDVLVWTGGGAGMTMEVAGENTRKTYEGLIGLKLFRQKIEEQLSSLTSDIKATSEELFRLTHVQASMLKLLDSLFPR